MDNQKEMSMGAIMLIIAIIAVGAVAAALIWTSGPFNVNPIPAYILSVDGQTPADMMVGDTQTFNVTITNTGNADYAGGGTLAMSVQGCSGTFSINGNNLNHIALVAIPYSGTNFIVYSVQFTPDTTGAGVTVTATVTP